MKLASFVFVVCASIISCDSNNKSNDGNLIWNSESQRIVIERSNGYTIAESDRFTTYDLAKDDIPSAISVYLESINVEKTELSCVEDGVTYDVTITDSSGIEHQFYSTNKSCNGITGEGFILVDDLNVLVSML